MSKRRVKTFFVVFGAIVGIGGGFLLIAQIATIVCKGNISCQVMSGLVVGGILVSIIIAAASPK